MQQKSTSSFKVPSTGRSHLIFAALVAWLALAAAPAQAATPPVPAQPVPACDATVAGKCYVNGAFSLFSFSSGAHHYKVCRSENTTAWGGCSVTITTNTQMPFTVSGGHLPGDGFRRAYYVSACDAANNCTRWADNDEAYVYMDLTAPTAPGNTTTSPACAVGATGLSGCWLSAEPGFFDVRVTPASDAGSGVGAYQYCRSHDSTGGFAGCNVFMTSSGGTSFRVAGSHLPSPAFRRAYRARAQDRVGNIGPWNSPVYVRLDYADPVVSASNASNAWVKSQTATLTAHDASGGSDANSGLSQVRYKWNAALNSVCTDGTLTSNGAVLQVPAGDNRLYLCARDFTGRVGTWNGVYRVDNTLPQHVDLTISSDVWSLYDETTLTADCEKGNCYDVAVQVSDTVSGVREIRTLINLQGSNTANRRGYFSWRHPNLSYQWSADQVPCTGGGFASKHPTNYNPGTVKLVGCTTSLAGGRRTVTFKVRPNLSFGEHAAINDISAWSRDFALNVAAWRNYNLNFRSRLGDDTTPPTLDSVAVSSPTWTADRSRTYNIVAKATDLGSGVREIRTVIDLQGSNSSIRRGFFSWRDQSLGYAFQKNRVQCTGGGWGSMHHTLHGATRSTLEACSTSLKDGVERTVTFTLRPNETFGDFDEADEPRHDVSMRAWDFDLNKPLWTNFNLDFASNRPADQRGDLIGYGGLIGVDGLNQSISEGIAINIGTLQYLRKECSVNYWRTVDTPAVTTAYEAQGVKAMVIMENFLFHDVNDPIGDDCQPLDPPPPLDPSACFNNQKWRLLDDWQARLDEFVSLHGAALNAQNVAFFLMSSEVNDRCFLMSEVLMAAEAVRARFPGIPLGFFYGASHNRDGIRISQPPPSSFPAIFDVVGFFSYDNLNINDPLDVRNATGSYYNPENPTDTATIYGDLLSKIQTHQDVLLVFDTDFNSGNALQGWVEEDLSALALNYAEFMTFRPEVKILGGAPWQGLLQLPLSVRQTHATLACEAFVNNSPLCN